MGKKLNKEELGNKVLCPECETKFYDLGKTPIVCPSCEFSFSINNKPEEKTDEDQTAVIEAVKSEEVVSEEEIVSQEEVEKDSEKTNEDETFVEDEVLPEIDGEDLGASKDDDETEEDNIEGLEEFDLEDDIDESIDDSIDGEETF